MQQRDYLDIASARDKLTFEQRLVGFAEKLGFPLVSAILVVDQPSREAVFVPVGNTPPEYEAYFANVDRSRQCPVLKRLKAHGRPFHYDQALYVQDGVGDLWESQAPFGYRCGIAMAQHMPNGRHFLLGVDRDEDLPVDDEAMIRLMGHLQLLGAYAQETAVRVLSPLTPAAEEVPTLDQRELEVLRWTRDGKTAWEVGQILCLSESTVRYHLRRAQEKLGVAGKQQAVVKAMNLRLL